MTVTREEMTLLDLATGDYYNIWEAACQLAKTSISETYDVSVARARRVLLSMQSKGLIKFYKYSCQRRDHQEIAADEVTAALDQYMNWDPDDVNNLQFQIKFSSTESGNTAYEQLWHTVMESPATS